MANIMYYSRTVEKDVLLFLNLAPVLKKTYFRFCSLQLNVLLNRQYAANMAAQIFPYVS